MLLEAIQEAVLQEAVLQEVMLHKVHVRTYGGHCTSDF